MEKQPQHLGPVKVKYHKTRAHTLYKLTNGQLVPGATTILKVLDKPALIHWAWSLGIKGEDYRKVRDQAADIGTLAHWMAECHIKGLEPDLSDFSKNDIDKAENSFLKFLEWWDKGGFTAVALQDQSGEVTRGEVALVSEAYKYGGTIDLPAKDRHGEDCLIDFKTSKGIYDEYWFQVAAYENLLLENTIFNPRRKIIVRIGKKEAGDFDVQEKSDLRREWEVFQHCVSLHYLLKK